MAAMIESEELDERDIQLLSYLIHDGRMSYSALADELGLSVTATRYRMDRLISNEFVSIEGQIDPAFLGRPVHAWIQAHLRAENGEVRTRMATMPQLDFVHWTENPQTGETKVEGHGSFADHEEIVSFVGEHIRPLPGVDRVEIVVGLRIHAVQPRFGPFYASVDPGDWIRSSRVGSLDEVDLRIACLLRHDGRLSFASLGRDSGLSAAATRARYLSMVERGVLRVRTMPNIARLGYHGRGHFSIVSRGPIDDLVDRLVRLPAAIYVNELTGRHNVRLAVVTQTVEEFRALALSELSNRDDVLWYETELYSGVAKEFVAHPEPHLPS